MWSEELFQEIYETDNRKYLDILLKQTRMNTWLSYFAGSDIIGFDLGGLVDRDETVAKIMFLYLSRLNQELVKLPIFKPKPSILLIQHYTDFYAGGIIEHNLFNEWDTINQYAFTENDINLSQYDVILADETWYFDKTVEKLNDFVVDGGDLIILGSFSDMNVYENATRSTKFLFEENADLFWTGGEYNFTISEPNDLNLTMDLDKQQFEVLAFYNSSATENLQLIGEMYATVDGNKTAINASPLVLYHNIHNQDEGSIFFWGVDLSSDKSYLDFDITNPDDWTETTNLRKQVISAFIDDIGIKGSFSSSVNEGVIITTSELDDDSFLAGIANVNETVNDLQYTFDLSRYNLKDGTYLIYYLDENNRVESVVSKENKLDLTFDLPNNTAKFIFISTINQEPSYTIDTNPEVPTAEDVKDMWPKPYQIEDLFEPVMGITIILLSVIVIFALIRQERRRRE
jgi:hypothetical protein